MQIVKSHPSVSQALRVGKHRANLKHSTRRETLKAHQKQADSIATMEVRAGPGVMRKGCRVICKYKFCLFKTWLIRAMLSDFECVGSLLRMINYLTPV